MKIVLKASLIGILVILHSASVIAAPGKAPCYKNFYQTKSIECINTLIKAVNHIQANQNRDVANHLGVQPIVGVLAVVFNDFPQEKNRILYKENNSAIAKGIYIEALYRAGLLEEAKTYANANKLSAIFEEYQKRNLPTINAVKPVLNPGDNDLLIGAYAASGKAEYIHRILENYTTVDNSMASTAFRMALMNSKFGPTMTPPGREKTMVNAICEKYTCKVSPKNFLRLATLSSGLWALSSLAQGDKAIKKTFTDFFESDARLKSLFSAEKIAFSNYLTMLIASAGVKDNPQINASLTAYETLGTPQQAVEVIK